MGQKLRIRLRQSLRSEHSITGNKAPALAAVLFHQPHAVDDHAAVGGFAHVVDGQEGGVKDE